jgi:dienelactone hydrolase
MNLSSKTIDYESNGTRLCGYLAWDDDLAVPGPGVIVIHEWWGLNGYIRERADLLAENGFTALAIDMYGDGKVAENPDQAGAAMNSVLEDMETGTARLTAGYEALIAQSRVDAGKTAAIGYCFGGAMALHMARIGLPLSAVASFHGALGSFHNPTPGEVKASVLVCHGGDDAMVSVDDVAEFRKEMDAAQVEYEVIVYVGAQHGFTSKEADLNGEKYGIPVGYNARADEESWAAMMSLFDRKLR